MVDLIEEVEAVPAAYPTIDPRWLGGEAVEAIWERDPGSNQIWQRIEAYTRTRYTPREVIWIIDAMAGDEWQPPLGPIVSQTAERWDGDAWASVTLADGSLGLSIPSDGRFRITAQVGGGASPPAVQEAFLRLHEYARGIAESYKGEAAVGYEDGSLPPSWAARSLQLSGAADMLRPYKRRA